MGALGWVIALAIVAIISYLIFIYLAKGPLRPAAGQKGMQDRSYLRTGESISDGGLTMLLQTDGNLCIMNKESTIWCAKYSWGNNPPRQGETEFMLVFENGILTGGAVQSNGSLRPLYSFSLPGAKSVKVTANGPAGVA
jgi:hypothetical protein